jgi:predicted Zn-dependent protease
MHVYFVFTGTKHVSFQNGTAKHVSFQNGTGYAVHRIVFGNKCFVGTDDDETARMNAAAHSERAVDRRQPRTIEEDPGRRPTI